jgi:hypothetical protein
MSTACDKGVDSFSLLPAGSSFKQGAAFAPRKVDILWLVDSSGSMASSQQALATNFSKFIQDFKAKNFDFQMAVADTGSYLDHFYTNAYSKFKDGKVDGSTHSKVFIMDKDTPNLDQVFMTNVTVGTTGTGDERAFTSFESALVNPLNAGFHRPGALLIIIIVSDEDDFSHNDWSPTKNYYFTESYNDPKAPLFSIAYYQNFLNTYTNSTAATAKNNYVVHNISILDSACLSKLGDSSQKISKRYQQLSTATGGLSSSLCADMGSVLATMAQQTLELASVFQLDREPDVNTLSVVVDGTTIPNSATNGWTYDASNWTISFHGFVPAAGSDIRINFEPLHPQM